MRRLRDWEFESRLLQRRVGRTRIAFARLCTLLRQVKALLRRSAQTSAPRRSHPLSALHAELSRRRGTPRPAGLDISYETVRYWVLKFGPVIARRLRRRRPRSSNRWHLDEMVVRIAGQRMG